MEGTVLEDLIRDPVSYDNPLLEYQSESESDDQDALESLQHLTAYWITAKQEMYGPSRSCCPESTCLPHQPSFRLPRATE